MSLEQRYEEQHKSAIETESTPTFNLRGWPRHRIEAIIAESGTGHTVLDVGCSDGVLLHHLRDRFENLVGLEYSAEALIRATRLLSDSNFRGVNGSAEDMSQIESESVDVIVTADVVEHVPDVYAAADEMFRVLRPSGKLVINTPNVAFVKKRLLLMLGRFPSTSQPNEGLGSDSLFDGGHLHYFTFRSLRLLLQKSGFKIQRELGFGPFGQFHNVWPSLFSPAVQIVATK